MFLLALVGGGAGAAYVLGWFGPEDVHAAPPPAPCDLFDADAAGEIAGNGPNLEVFDAEYDYVFDARGLECVAHPGAEAASGHEVRMRSLVFASETIGIRRESGAERATSYFYGTRPAWTGDPLTCANGRQPLSGTDGGLARAQYRLDNLVLEVEVHPADADVEEALDEPGRVQAAVDLVCDAVDDV
ncbi:hypothetical protein ACIBFB_13290 [Nocardiopsis sp. NPDC050513]|uniref:hypothetical protein n=1 Tax=Nocardiopsis sp. NPDC050513 TaxID=3364338 RepID=UPI00379D7E59